MKTRLSQHTIIAATLITSAIAGMTSVKADEYRVISADLNAVTETCDRNCKTSLSAQAHSAKDWFNIGVSLIKKDDFAAADYALNKSLKIAKQDNNFSLVASALIELGGISYIQKNYSLSEGYFTGAIEASEEAEDPLRGAQAYLNLGLVQRRMDDKIAARKTFRNSLRLTRGTKLYALRVNALFQYGRILKEQNNKAWAKKALLKSRILSKKYAFNTLYNASERELSAMGIGRAQVSKRVIKTFTKATLKTKKPTKIRTKATPRKIAKKETPTMKTSWIMRDQDMAVTYDRLGVTHMANRQYDMASDMFRKSIFINEQIGDIVAQAKGFQNLAKIYLKLGDHKNSCVNFWQARSLMTKANENVQDLTRQLKKNSCLLQQASADFQ